MAFKTDTSISDTMTGAAGNYQLRNFDTKIANWVAANPNVQIVSISATGIGNDGYVAVITYLPLG